nr:hypothetical protein [Rhizobium sp. CFBP 8762]
MSICYPIDWAELSISIRFRRAKGRCEHCERPHGRQICALPDGRWFDADISRWRDNRGRRVRTNLPSPPDLPPEFQAKWTKVFLACAHLDHNLSNNQADNLAALCQRCHLANDRTEHLARRRITYRKRWALGDLFTGTYSA